MFDLLLGRLVTEREAASGLAAAFGVAAGDTVVVSAPAGGGVAEGDGSPRVLGVLYPVEGSFPLLLKVVMCDAALEHELRRVDPVAIVGRFCAEVGVPCFVEDAPKRIRPAAARGDIIESRAGADLAWGASASEPAARLCARR